MAYTSEGVEICECALFVAPAVCPTCGPARDPICTRCGHLRGLHESGQTCLVGHSESDRRGSGAAVGGVG